MTPGAWWTAKKGARVAMASPHGEMRRGDMDKALSLGAAFLQIGNGALGTIVGTDGERWLVEFDDLAPGVVVSVPAHWVASAPAVTP